MTATRSDELQPDGALELTLRDMLAEPIVRLVMARDGVREQDLIALMEEVRRRLGPRLWHDAA